MMVPWIISHIFIRQTKLTLTFVAFGLTFLNSNVNGQETLSSNYPNANCDAKCNVGHPAIAYRSAA